MFNTIYSANVTGGQFLLMAVAALISGVIFSWLISFRVKASKRYFTVISLMPFIVGMVITFISGSIGAGVAFGGVFGLTRFRSAPGSADEIAGVLIAMAAGVPFGMGYIGYGVLALLVLGLLFVALNSVNLFEHKAVQQEKMLKITIPETLDYARVFDDIFDRYLTKAEAIGVKTTGMGAMFLLTFKIVMKDPAQEKALIDDLRIRNGNLEIAILPYVERELTL